ncbi:MAG: GNAT family N-acetyltransferase [Persicimonas sp.]
MPAILSNWCSAEQLHRDIGERLQVELDRCEDMGFATRFAAACPVEGCQPEDYLQGVIRVGGRQQLLTGIRFHGGLGFPFVDLIAAAQPLDDAAAMADALAAIRAEYAPFEPQTVRILRGSERPLMLPSGINATADQHVVVGPIDVLAAQPTPSPREEVQLAPAGDTAEAARFVEAAYDAFYAEQPAFESIIFPADQSDLEECQETGLLRYISVDGARAGVVATRDGLGPFVCGQEMVEQVLNPDFRGRGIAAIAQRRLLEQLAEQSPGEVIWGTIDDRNVASRATAHRAGRRELASWHWLNWNPINQQPTAGSPPA